MSNLTDKVANSLTETQLKLIGFETNDVWHKNREMLGHKDGEDFETFFHRKHGYKSDQDEIEQSKGNFSLEELHEKLRVNKVFLTIFPWHYKNYEGWNIENGVLYSTDKSKEFEYKMPKEFTLFAVLKKDGEKPLLSYMHNSNNNFDWEYSKFPKQLHISTFKDGIFTSYNPASFKPDTTFEKTKIPDINILHGIGSIYDIIVYNHAKSEQEITRIGDLLKDIHNLHKSTIRDAFEMLTKQVKGMVEQHLLIQKQISMLNTRIGINHPLKPTQKLLNALK